MSGIKRYDAGSGVNERANGRFVRFADHERVVAELENYQRVTEDTLAAKHEVIASLRAELAALEDRYEGYREAAIEETARLRAEADSLRKDAERYRWLRDEYDPSIHHDENEIDEILEMSSAKLDQFIDGWREA